MQAGNVHYMAGRRRMTPQGAARMEAALARYIASLRALDSLRFDRSRQSESDYAARLSEASRHVKEAFVEWLMLYEHETGVKLEILRE